MNYFLFGHQGLDSVIVLKFQSLNLSFNNSVQVFHNYVNLETQVSSFLDDS